jgi:EAL domain-containing protein (putative c-di-GMP-specific phosphodiesterase class I)
MRRPSESGRRGIARLRMGDLPSRGDISVTQSGLESSGASHVIVRVLMSRSVLLPAAAVGMLFAVCVVCFAAADPGVMLFAVLPITLLAMLYGVRGGLASAAVASAAFLVWTFTQGHPSAVNVIDEPIVFFTLGLITGIYAHGALGDTNPREALRRAEFRTGLRRGEVVFHYQPLADTRTQRVVALEALARWEHPVRGLLNPAEFIPLAERDEPTMWELTLLAIDRSLADLADWGEPADELTIWINLSAVSLGRRDLAAEFSRILDQHGYPGSRLAVEVTETALVAIPRRGVQALVELKRLGMTIVLDDFGAGQSSISRLGQLPIDIVKVDLQLIGPPSADDAQRVLNAIIELARALGLHIAAERIEDDDTWREVAQLGFDLVQGSRLSPPLPADQVQRWLEHPPVLPRQSTMSQLP